MLRQRQRHRAAGRAPQRPGQLCAQPPPSRRRARFLRKTSEHSSFACPKPHASAKRTQRRQLHWQRVLSPATAAHRQQVPESPPTDTDIHAETRRAPQKQRFPSHVAQFTKDSPFLLGQALQLHIKHIQLVSISHGPEKHSPSLTQTTTLEFPRL